MCMHDKQTEFLSDSDLVALSEDDEVSDTVNRQQAGLILSSLPYLLHNIISLHNIPSVSHNENVILTQSFQQADLEPGPSAESLP